MKEANETVCRDPSNELLPWYLNGSLEPVEAERVRGHLDACAICSKELDELASFAGAFAYRGASPASSGASPGGLARRRVLWFGFAAAAAVVVAALFLWPRGERETGARPPAGITIASIDLGAGETRGQATPPSLRLDGGIAQVDILFTPPVDPEASYEVEIQDSQGRIRFRSPRRSLVVDRDGRSRQRVGVEVLSFAGVYLLRLREFAAGGEVHEYAYPFRVIAPDSR